MELFFIVGPNRTGTSLLTRCLDDHPECICLWESHINRIVFEPREKQLYQQIMLRHGLSLKQIEDLKTLLKTNDFASMRLWYNKCAEILQSLYQKSNIKAFGDKEPRWYWSPEGGTILKRIKAIKNYPRICTIRHPLAVWWSGESYRNIIGQGDRSLSYYLDTYQALKLYLDRMLVIRYEDLVLNPVETMKKIYHYIGLDYDSSFLNRDPKPFDERFWWHVDTVRKFNHHNVDKWKHNIKKEKVKKICSIPTVREILETYQYQH